MAHAFLVGSSIAATLITLVYTGRAFRGAGRPSSVPFEVIAIVVPIAFGLANVINVRLGNTIKTAFFVGAVLGLLFSMGGRFVLQLPEKIFNMKRQSTGLVHLVAPIVYALIFAIIVRQLNLVQTDFP